MEVVVVEEYLEDAVEDVVEEVIANETPDEDSSSKLKQKKPKPIDCYNCKYVCSRNFSEATRREICKSFWKLSDYRRQKDFILMNVKSAPPKRRRPPKQQTIDGDVTTKHRSNSKTFFLLDRRVCQSFFLKTLCISNGPLLKAFEHINEYTNFFDGEDQRGRHPPANKIPEAVVDLIVHFISEVANASSNPKSRKRVIDESVPSLKGLYEKFKDEYEDSGMAIPSLTSFKRIFYQQNFTFSHDRAYKRVGQESQQQQQHQGKHPTPYKNVKNEMIEEEVVVVEEHLEEDDGMLMQSEIIKHQPQQQQSVIVAQVNDPSKFNFNDPTQVYEIQFIEMPIENSSS